LEGSVPPPGVAPPPGFKSPKARRNFFLLAALAATAVVALQALLWLWLTSQFPSAGEPRWGVRLENVHAESAAVWRGDLWYVTSEITSGFESPENRGNNQLVQLTEQGPKTVLMLAPGAAWLLAQGDTLWIFASDGVSHYDGKTAEQVPAKQLTESASQPFLLDGLPAAVQEAPGERRAMALENGQWVEKAQLFFGDPKDAPAARGLKVLEIGAQPYVFCPKGDTLYCHAGFPGKDARFPADWETVGPVGDLWAVAENEGRPEAFTFKAEKDRISVEIVGLARYEAEGPAAGSAAAGSAGKPAASWKPSFSRISPFPLRTLGAASDAARGCRVVYQALQWTVNVVHLEDEKVVSARRYGDMNPADRVRALLGILPTVASGVLSLALAFVLSGLMKIYRTDSFSGPAPSAGNPGQVPSAGSSGQGWSAPCASLTRRALALFLDATLVLGPLVAGMFGLFWILPGIEDQPDPRGVTYLTPLLFGGALWAVAGFLIFCYTLGRWGRTPGKWAMGIRVIGMELAPCGFGRALLRTLLLIVDGFLFADGFLNFSFGALVIACTANRQRVGDMAARTIVIREAAQPAPVQRLDTRV
jgi:uncharacterized RDD family membrane protein YckC